MSKKTLNTANLAALGADQLAELLMEISTGSADIKRRLRLELSYNLGADDLAHEVRKRLASLRKSNTFVGWRKREALVKDLSTQAAMITDKIGPDDPTIAFDLLWDFIDMAPAIYGRTDDSKGDVSAVFDAAITRFADLAPLAVVDSDGLADRVWAALQDNAYGQWAGIITLLALALGADGLARLAGHVQAFADVPMDAKPDDHVALRFLRELRGGDDFAAARKARFVKATLQEIAIAAGDNSAYIAQFTPDDLRQKPIAAEVAMLLLANDRGGEALDILRNADDDDAGQNAWDAAYIATLSALGQTDDAQAHRWACFTETLDPAHLRAYLKQLPDFDDVEAEDEARRHVLTFPNFGTALGFCIAWPDLPTAARLVDARIDAAKAEHFEVMATAADALRDRVPQASVLLWRTMVDFILLRGWSQRYANAADHLTDLATIDAALPDGDHAAYLAELRVTHERKYSFWNLTA